MFEILLKEKLQTESKIKSLQTRYLKLRVTQFEEIVGEKKSEETKQILDNHFKALKEIRDCYQAILRQFKEVNRVITDAEETLEEIEAEVDAIVQISEIELPQELILNNNKSLILTTNTNDFQEEDKENSTLQQNFEENEEEEDNSDKENSILNAINFSKTSSDSETYSSPFSPNVRIQKSFVGDHTPAIKTTSRLPTFKRH